MAPSISLNSPNFSEASSSMEFILLSRRGTEMKQIATARNDVVIAA